jgi:hypothetical protein
LPQTGMTAARPGPGPAPSRSWPSSRRRRSSGSAIAGTTSTEPLLRQNGEHLAERMIEREPDGGPQALEAAASLAAAHQNEQVPASVGHERLALDLSLPRPRAGGTRNPVQRVVEERRPLLIDCAKEDFGAARALAVSRC